MTVKQQNEFFMRRYEDTWRNDTIVVFEMYVVKLKNFFWFRSLIGNATARLSRS